MRRSPGMFLLALLLTILAACGGAEPSAPAATSAPSAPKATAMLAPTAMPQPTAAPAAKSADLTVFAASSLADAFKAIGKMFEASNAGTTVTSNFAGSDKLAQQILIQYGFISATGGANGAFRNNIPT